MPKVGYFLKRVLLSMGAAMALGAGSVSAATHQATFFGPSVPIPDNSATGVTIALPVSGIPGTVGRLTVSFDGAGPVSADPSAGRNAGVNHPWVSDLVMTLIAPSGNSVVLMNRINQGQGGVNFSQLILDDSATDPIQRAGSDAAPFSGAWRPNSPLSVLNGEPINGTWQLFVQDLGAGDVGTVEQFTLHFETSPTAPVNLPPLATINTPSADLTQSASTVTASGFAVDLDGTVSRVEYTLLGTETWQEVDSLDGAVWTINNLPLSPGANFLGIRATDNRGRRGAEIYRAITVDPDFVRPPMIDITFPAGQSGFISTQTTNITIEGTTTATDNPVVRVEARPFSTAFPWEVVTNLTGNWARWEYRLNGVPTDPAGTLVEFRAIDLNDVASPIASRRIFRVGDNVRPGVEIVEPSGDRQIPPSQTTFNFSGNALDIDGFLRRVEFRITTETTFETDFQPIPPPETDFGPGPGDEDVRSAARELARSFTREWRPAENLSDDWRRWSFVADELEEGVNIVEVRALDNEEQFSVRESRRITRGAFAEENPLLFVSVPATDIQIGATETTFTFSGTTTTVGDGEEALIEIVEYNLNGEGWRPVADNGSNFETWQVTLMMLEGFTNEARFRARDISGRQSNVVRRTLTRPVDNRPRATVAITSPATNVLLEPGTRSIEVSGTATPAQSPIEVIQYRSARTTGQLILAPWVTHEPEDEESDLRNWTIDFLLPRDLNVFQVRAIDADGRPSNPASRTINRQVDRPLLTITSPVETMMVPASRESVTVTGFASIDLGDVVDVRWRNSTGLISAVPWRSATVTVNEEEDRVDFTFQATLQTGTNRIEVQAIGPNEVASETGVRTVVKLKQVPPDDLLVLTEFGDVWAARNAAGQLQTPLRYGPSGFQQNVPAGHKTFGGDFTGNGLTDLVTVTSFRDMWIAVNQGTQRIGVPVRAGNGLRIDEANGVTVLSADFTGNGLTDLLQILQSGDLLLARNLGGTLASPPVAYGNPGVLYSLEDGLWVTVGDMNGDGLPDLIQVDNFMGEVRVALNTGTGFAAARAWGTPGFVYDPANALGVHVGDFNGDGFADLAEIREGDARVALSNSDGTGLLEPTFWGRLGFHSDITRGKGWWVFVLDADGDQADDLVQINEFGEAWFAISDGVTTFNVPPPLNAPLGYEHKPDGRWQVFPGRAIPITP